MYIASGTQKPIWCGHDKIIMAVWNHEKHTSFSAKLVLRCYWMRLSYMHPVTSENQFHCTRLCDQLWLATFLYSNCLERCWANFKAETVHFFAIWFINYLSVSCRFPISSLTISTSTCVSAMADAACSKSPKSFLPSRCLHKRCDVRSRRQFVVRLKKGETALEAWVVDKRQWSAARGQPVVEQAIDWLRLRANEHPCYVSSPSWPPTTWSALSLSSHF